MLLANKTVHDDDSAMLAGSLPTFAQVSEFDFIVWQPTTATRRPQLPTALSVSHPKYVPKPNS